MNVEIGDNFREVPQDPNEMQEGIDFLMNKASALDVDQIEQASLLNLDGSVCANHWKAGKI